MADLLVLSKTDLVSESTSGAFGTRLRSLNPTADILEANRGVVPTAALWDLSGMRLQGKLDQVGNLSELTSILMTFTPLSTQVNIRE